jgi:hypothetical protein
MQFDDDEYVGLTQIEWDRKQKKNLKIGFAFLGFIILFMVAVSIWFMKG